MKAIIYGALAIGLLIAPWCVYPVLLMKIICFVLFAAAFNLFVGYAGLMSFGHAAFFSAGAYAMGSLCRDWGISPGVGLIAAAVVAGCLGAIIGALAIRRRGIYFSMITLAFSQMLYFYFLQAPFSGGEEGLQGVPRGSLFGYISLENDHVLYYFVVAVVIVCFYSIWRINHSPFGRIIDSVRENEGRAISLGYDAIRLKLVMFILSATFAGLAGALKTLVFGFATLVDADWRTSGEVILMTLLGGMGTLAGPAIGATVVVLLQNVLSDKVGSKVTIIIGLLFMFCVLAFRQGIVGYAKSITARITTARKVRPERSSKAISQSQSLETT